MLRTVFLSVFAAAFLVAGCASSPAATEADVPAATPVPASTPTLMVADEWTIKMTHSGGIMGLMRTVEISSDGSYTVIDERINKTVSGELSESELAELQEIVASLDYNTGQKPNPGGCADCFVYVLEIQGTEKNLNLQLDDISLPESGMETLVKFLRELIDSALK